MAENPCENSVITNKKNSLIHDTVSAMREYSSRYTNESPAEATRFLMSFIGIDEQTSEPSIDTLLGQLANKIDTEYVPRDVYDSIIEQRNAVLQQKEAAEKQTHAIEAQIQAIASERDARQMKNIRYQSECSALQQRCDKLSNDVASTVEERDNLHEKLDLLTEKHSQLTRELEASREDKNALQTSYKQLEQDFTTMQQANQAAQVRNEDLLAEIEHLNNISDANDAQLVELTRSQSNLKQSIVELTEERDTALRECNTTKQRLRELAAQYQLASNKNQQIENNHAVQEQYESQIQELKRQVQDFENEVETLQTRIKHDSATYTQAQENARIANIREEAIRQELLTIKKERDEAVQQAKKVTTDHNSIVQNYDNMLMIERGRFNAAIRNIRRKLMDAGIHSSIINVVFAGVGFNAETANGESADPEGDVENQRLIDSILASA